MGVLDRPEVIAVFARQHWVASVGQLAALGISRKVVHRARMKGVLASPLRSVVSLAQVELSFEGRAMAIQLAAGANGFISGMSAGVLHGLRGMPRQVIELTTREDHRVSLPTWGRLVKTSWVEADDVVLRPDGLRVASPLRTLFRLAGCFNQHRFERAAEDMWHRGLATPAQAARYLAVVRRQGRGGVARFEVWLDKALPRDRPAQSGLELDLLELIERAGLPTPARQHRLVLTSGETIHLDVAWPDVRLAIEPGHTWWHGGDVRMRNDSARDRACAEVGWHVVRYDETARDDPAATAKEVSALYRQRAMLIAGSLTSSVRSR